MSARRTASPKETRRTSLRNALETWKAIYGEAERPCVRLLPKGGFLLGSDARAVGLDVEHDDAAKLNGLGKR